MSNAQERRNTQTQMPNDQMALADSNGILYRSSFVLRYSLGIRHWAFVISTMGQRV